MKTTASALNYSIPLKAGSSGSYPFLTYGLASGVTVGNLSVATYGTLANNLPWPISPYAVLNRTAQQDCCSIIVMQRLTASGN
ncbi:MAG: hypothetical protein U0X76_00095 [Bacteroidia bacterium]